MNKHWFKTTGFNVTDVPSFKDASAEELRVLLAMAASDSCLSYGELASYACVSEARAISAAALWEAEGVIVIEYEDASQGDNINNINIKEEFVSGFSSDMHEEEAVETAKTVRDNELSALLTECATLMNKPTLSTEEVKKITSLYSQLALSEEYIFTLAAHLAEGGKLTATLLAKRAEKLVERGIDTAEELERYIEDSERESAADREFRRIFGIYGRNLSKSEQSYFRKWSCEYGFSSEIVGEAYDITILNTGKTSLSYMDKILAKWHAQGCTTVAMCREQLASDKNNLKAAEKGGSRPKSEKGKKTMKYADFDAGEAFRRALERSFGSEEEKDN